MGDGFFLCASRTPQLRHCPAPGSRSLRPRSKSWGPSCGAMSTQLG